MNKTKLIVGALGAVTANAALAGSVVVPLGTPGISLGVALSAVLGVPLGSVLPIESIGLLFVGAVSLVTGIYIVRNKRNR